MACQLIFWWVIKWEFINT